MTDPILELLKLKEELHPDLKPYFFRGDNIVPGIFHKLVIAPFHHPQANALVNRQYLQKMEKLKAAENEGDWDSYVFLHERPYRLEAFLEIEEELQDKQYWKLLSDVFTDSENVWQNMKRWEKCLSAKREHSVEFMKREDRKVFKTLPETLTIYRGFVRGKNERGFSYTLSREKAEWFSKRFGKEGAAVKELVVKKDEIFAYMNGRGEQEIILRKAR